MNYTQEQINAIVFEARHEAGHAATKYLNEKLGGQDQYACGFAWVDITGIKGSTKLGKMLDAAGVNRDYRRIFQMWNPSGLSVQNVDTKEAGARAAADVLKRYGFSVSVGTRLD